MHGAAGARRRCCRWTGWEWTRAESSRRRVWRFRRWRGAVRPRVLSDPERWPRRPDRSEQDLDRRRLGAAAAQKLGREVQAEAWSLRQPPGDVPVVAWRLEP